MSSQSVTIRELISSGLTLSWQEAVALTQGVAGASSTCLSRVVTDSAALQHFALRADGTVHATSADCAALSVGSLAMFLGRLLPAEPTDPSLQTPEGVHFAVGRALGLVQSEPFASLEHFSTALTRYEMGEREPLLRDVFDRYESARQARLAPASVAVSVERRSTSPPPDTLRRLLRDADHQAWLAAGRHAHGPDWAMRRQGPDPEMLRRFLREADQRNYELARRAGMPMGRRRSIAAAGFARITRAARRAMPLERKGRFAGPWSRSRVAAGLGILLVAAGAAAERQPLGNALSVLVASFDLSTSARRGADEGGRAFTSGRSAAAVPQVLVQALAVGPAHRTTKGRAGVVSTAGLETSETMVGTDGESEAGASSLDPLPVLPTGRMVEALDVAERPVFSPSFAANRAALFDNDTQPAGNDAAGFVHVLSLANDRGRNYHPRLSPDGSTIAFDSDRDGSRGVYLASRDGRNVRRISGPEQYAAFPAWSPDGNHLAFVQSEPGQPTVWNVWSADVRSGAMARLTWFRDGQPWGVSWFPDGNRICFAHEKELVVLDTSNGASQSYASPRTGKLVRMPIVSPDGARVVFQLDSDGAWLLELTDGSMRQVLADPSVEDCVWSKDGKRLLFRTRDGSEWTSWSLTPEPDISQ